MNGMDEWMEFSREKAPNVLALNMGVRNMVVIGEIKGVSNPSNKKRNG